MIEAARTRRASAQSELGVPVEKLGKLLRIEDAVVAVLRAGSCDKDVAKDD